MTLNSCEAKPATQVYPMPAATDRPNTTIALPVLPDVPGPIPRTTTTSTTAPDSEPDVHEQLRALLLDLKGKNLPEIDDTVEFLSNPMVQPKVLIEGALHQGSKMIIGSGSKSFKTWTLLDLAISVASGVAWLGLQTSLGRVLFLNFELKPSSIRDRICAIKQAKQVEWEAGMFHLWNLRGHAADYEVIIPRIIQRVESRRYDLIILDPVYKLYGDTDENSAGDVAQLMNELERLAVQTGAAVVFSAHFSKGNQAGKESVDRVSGSGVFARDPDTILSFTKHEKDNCFVVESTLRDFKQLAPFVVRWEYPLMVRDETLNPARLKSPLAKKPTHSIDDLLIWVKQETITTKDLMRCVMDQTGMSQSLFYKLSAELTEVPGVTFTPEGKTWTYTSVVGK